jgi:hypothetical protein
VNTGWYSGFDGRILYVDTTVEYSSLEGWGLRLFNSTAARMRDVLSATLKRDNYFTSPDGRVPEGPHFVYDISPAIFHTRTGRGPLYVAWDTNLLINYFKFGRMLWEGDGLPDVQDDNFAGELEGLQFLIALWVLRDIRFIILPSSINDAKKKLPAERRASRFRAFDEFTSALRLVSSDSPDVDLPSRDGLLILPDSLLEQAVAKVPRGFDQILVRAAAHMGIHVFMTMDKQILKQRQALRSFGLLLASPLDLLEELIRCGAFHCMLEPRFAYWPMPDQMRVGHLIRALPTFDASR